MVNKCLPSEETETMDHIFSYNGKKGDILRASIELFSENGYDGVSVRDIAKKAGVTEAALYKHFKSKEDMSLYLFTVINREYCGRITKINAHETSAIKKLQNIVIMTYDLFEAFPAVIGFALLSQHNFWNRITDDIRPHLMLKNILEEGIKKGEIRDEAVYLLISVYTGLLLEPLAQFRYFSDVLPPMSEIKKSIVQKVEKVLSV